MNRLETFTTDAKRAYILLGSTIGLFFAGLAPAILFGYSLYSALLTLAWNTNAAKGAGISLSITMEIVGGLSAYVAQNARNPNTRYFGYGVLGVYTAIGLIYMVAVETNPIIQRTGFMAYLVAPLLYFAVALLNATLQQQADKQAARGIMVQERQDDREWQRKQEERKMELEYQARMEKMRLDTEVKKAKVESEKVSKEFPVGNIGNNLVAVEETAKGRMQRIWKPGMTVTELANQAGVSKGYASKYVGNGAMKHWQLTNGGSE